MAGVQMPLEHFEINLLQEPHRRPGVSAAVVLATVLFLTGVLVPVWLWHDANGRIEANLDRLSGLDRQLLELQAQNEGVSDAHGADALLAAVGDLRQFRPPAGGMMDKLNRLLPVEANLHGLVYANGRIQLMLDFATMEHIITFLNEIEQSEAFTLVSFGTMNNKETVHPEQAEVPAGLSWAAYPEADDAWLSLAGEPDLPGQFGEFGEVVTVLQQKDTDYVPVTSVVFELAYQSGHTAFTGEQEGQAQ